MNCKRRAFKLVARVTLGAFLWSFVISPGLCVAQTEAPAATKSEIVRACEQGQADAKSGHSSTGYVVGGFFCGVFGLIFATSSDPQAPADKLVGQSADYVATYTRCYKQEAKSKNLRSSLIGWGIGVVVVATILVASNGSSSSGY